LVQILLFLFKNGIVFNFVIYGSKKGKTADFSPSSFLLFLDPESALGSGINIPDPQHCFEANTRVADPDPDPHGSALI
jgi:hypothetical protein